MGKDDLSKYIQLYFIDLDTMFEFFDEKQIVGVLRALKEYAQTGVVSTPPHPETRVLFSRMQKGIDAAKAKYQEISNVKAENGRKGGQAKAANAANKASTFKPSTLKQFHDAVNRYMDSEDIEDIEEADDYDVDAFFDSLKEAGWRIGGEPIQLRSDWESAILARFGATPPHFTHKEYYSVFKTIFSTLHAQRDGEGLSRADNTAYDFFDNYDEHTQTWDINGEKIKDIKAALAQFLKQYTERVRPKQI